MHRFPLGLDSETRRNLRDRAKAHGVSQSAYVRALINGHRPGAEPGTEAAIADSWYDSRPPARRVSVAKNHAPHLFTAAEESAEAEQLTMFDGEDS